MDRGDFSLDRAVFNLGTLELGPLELPNAPVRKEEQARNYDINNLFRKAEKNSGVLILQGKKHKADESELEYIEDIGHGSCGTVTKRSYKGNLMAVKTMPRTSNQYEMSRILMDLNVICQSFDCPYIVRSYGYFITQHDVQVTMECMAKCLDRLIVHIKQPIPERIIGKMSISILKALSYLKDTHQIMHRDVKPSNILLDWNGIIKLCDFGIAGKLIESRAYSKQAGCPLYMAPERLDARTREKPYDITSDVWSFGLTLVELATGKYPFFDSQSDFEMMTRIVNDDPPRLNVKDGFTPPFCNIVERCLQYLSSNRPRYAELLDHDFIRNSELEDTDVEDWFHDVMKD